MRTEVFEKWRFDIISQNAIVDIDSPVIAKKPVVQKREELIVEISPSGAVLKRIPLEQFRTQNKI